DSKQLYQTLLKEQVTVAYGKLFSVDEKLEHYLRLNTSFSDSEHLESAIKKLGSLVREATV
ncbi:PLP-dependent aminotransferase family protein, partial [Vibrio owensii]